MITMNGSAVADDGINQSIVDAYAEEGDDDSTGGTVPGFKLREDKGGRGSVPRK